MGSHHATAAVIAAALGRVFLRGRRAACGVSACARRQSEHRRDHYGEEDRALSHGISSARAFHMFASILGDGCDGAGLPLRARSGYLQPIGKGTPSFS